MDKADTIIEMAWDAAVAARDGDTETAERLLDKLAVEVRALATAAYARRLDTP